MKDKILVIDDDKDICIMLQKTLSDGGTYTVKTVNTGEEGIKTASRSDYSVIILDLNLPDISGDKVLNSIRKKDIKTPVIILTGYPSLETAIEAVKNNANDYLLKPFKLDELRERISAEIEKNSEEKDLGITNITEIGKKIKELRKNKRMSLDILAEKTNLSKSFLSEVERKKKFPRLSTVENIARELEVDISFLLK